MKYVSTNSYRNGLRKTVNNVYFTLNNELMHAALPYWDNIRFRLKTFYIMLGCNYLTHTHIHTHTHTQARARVCECVRASGGEDDEEEWAC